MSAPNVNKPNEGLVGQLANSAQNAVNYVSDTIQGNTAEAKKEAHKEQAKGNVAGKDSLTDRASGLLNAGGDKMDEHTHKTSAEVNKQNI